MAAIASLLLMAASVIAAGVVAVQRFPRGVSVLACVVAAAAAAWWALTRRGPARAVALAGAGVLLAGAVALVVIERGVLEDALIKADIPLPAPGYRWPGTSYAPS